MPRFKARSSADTIRKRYVWTQIFINTENTEKKSPFSKVPSYVWTGPKTTSTPMMGNCIFENVVFRFLRIKRSVSTRKNG